MSVRFRILSVLVVVGLAAIAGGAAGMRWWILPGFDALEREQAAAELAQCRSLLDQEAQRLAALVQDWQRREQDDPFVEAALMQGEPAPPDMLAEAGLDFVVLAPGASQGGRRVVARQRGRRFAKGWETQPWAESAMAWARASSAATVCGLRMTSAGPALMAAAAWGPDGAAFVAGALLDEGFAASVARQTMTDFRILPLAAASILTETGDWRDLFQGAEPVFDTVGESLLIAYAAYPAGAARDAVLLQVAASRRITALGRRAAWYVGLAGLAAYALSLAVLYVAMQRAVVKPIEALQDQVTRIGPQAGPDAIALPRRNDEIGALAREFAQMVRRLEEARQRLLEQAYQAGQAEAAATVLHNVRNSLTPVLTELDMLREAVRGVPLDRMRQAQAELDAADTAPERAENLAAFVALARERAEAVLRRCEARIENARNHVRGIEDVLAGYDRLTRAQHPVSAARLDEVVQDALALLSPRFRERIAFVVDDSVAQIPQMHTCRPALTQAVAKVLRYGCGAIAEAAREDGAIRVSAEPVSSDEGAAVALRVLDNGKGPTAAELAGLFDRNSPAAGRMGSPDGLHWCALTLQALHGQITAAHSETGEGTVFEMVVPLDLRS